MGNGAGIKARRANPTALRTGGGRRLAGRNTVAAEPRVRVQGLDMAGRLDRARANNARQARRRNRPTPSAR